MSSEVRLPIGKGCASTVQSAVSAFLPPTVDNELYTQWFLAVAFNILIMDRSIY